MTICIAAIVDGWVGFVTDHRFSYQFVSSDEALKFKPVGDEKSWCAMFAADDVCYAAPILSRVHKQLGSGEHNA